MYLIRVISVDVYIGTSLNSRNIKVESLTAFFVNSFRYEYLYHRSFSISLYLFTIDAYKISMQLLLMHIKYLFDKQKDLIEIFKRPI